MAEDASRRDLGIAAALAALVALLFGRIIKLWWMFDDAFLLHYVTAHHPYEYFLRPAAWSSLQKTFTPLLMLSYDADVFFFGVDARYYYWHHLAELALLAVLLFACLRLWFDRITSASAVVIAFLGAPVVAWASQLMVRHYVEAAIAMTVAVIFYVFSVRNDAIVPSVISALAYFVAMSGKEIAVPLPLFLLLLPDGTRRRRFSSVVPHAMALALYVLWRRAMLGELLGGYGWAVRPRDYPHLVAELPMKTLRAFIGPNMIAGVAMLTVLATLCAFAIARIERAWLRLVVALVLTLAPFLPVSTQMELRFAVMAWAVIVIAACSGFAAIANRRVASALLVAAIVSAVAVHFFAWRAAYADAARMSHEAQFFMRMQPGDVLRNPLVPPAAMGELEWYKESILHRGAGAMWTYDDVYFCSHPPGFVFEYRDRVMNRVSDEVRRDTGGVCSAAQQRLPLRAHFEFEHGLLDWTLGPYSDGTYRFLIADGMQAFTMPRVGGYQLPGVDVLPIRIEHLDASGHRVYSPVITLQLRDGMRYDFAQ